jgi:hypothetical protein
MSVSLPGCGFSHLNGFIVAVVDDGGRGTGRYSIKLIKLLELNILCMVLCLRVQRPISRYLTIVKQYKRVFRNSGSS